MKDSRKWHLYQDVDNKMAGVTYVKTIRGEIIEGTLSIETYINRLIASYFIDKTDRLEEFIRNVLEKEFFTFGQKIRLMRRISRDFQEESPGLRDRFFRYLNYVMEIRNAIAHGKSDAFGDLMDDKDRLSFDKLDRKLGTIGEIKIKYFHEGKEKELELNDKFRAEWGGLSNSVIWSLMILTDDNKFVDSNKILRDYYKTGKMDGSGLK